LVSPMPCHNLDGIFQTQIIHLLLISSWNINYKKIKKLLRFLILIYLQISTPFVLYTRLSYKKNNCSYKFVKKCLIFTHLSLQLLGSYIRKIKVV
jgi:L-cystine uptake protein TcyP (sodium:dicarboxylate symporter family)